MSEYVKRVLKIAFPTQSRCVFLWGARKTGKSTHLKHAFPKAFRIDLLSRTELFRLSRDPGLLYREFNRSVVPTTPERPLILDEVQKIPELLDEVQRLIEDDRQYIVLCGSSARKLKRSHANLLGGRAWKYVLHPFSSFELGGRFELHRALNHGLIPDHYFGAESEKSIQAYVEDYLQQEVQMEGLTRNLPAFTRFLDAVGYSQGEIVNYSNIARDTGVDAKTIRQYFEILSDTHVGVLLEPWGKHKKRQVIREAPKFYFFDVGVGNYLAGRGLIRERSPDFGRAFEHFILMEMLAYRSYRERRAPLRYWRTSDGIEVDFIVGEGDLAIEAKATDNIRTAHAKPLLACDRECRLKRKLIVSLSARRSTLEQGVENLPWRLFLEELWAGRLF